MPGTPLAGRVRNVQEAEYLYLWTARTKVFGEMTFAEMRLVCRMLNFDDWVEPCIPDEINQVDRSAFVKLVWNDSLKGWRIRLIVISDHAGEALLVVKADSAMLNQKREPKIYKTREAVENDIHRLLQPENGEPVVCNVIIETTTSLPSAKGG